MNYSDSEKAVIVAKYKQGVTVQELSTEYGISERTIYRWTKQYSTISEMGLSSVRTTAKQDYLKQTAKEKKKDMVRQQFLVDRPNQIWVSDVTYFKLEQKHFYVCVIIDLFSRKVVSYKISKKNSTQLITSTFRLACETRQPSPGLIFHSDRGSQYTSHRFQQLLHERGMVQSFSNSGRPHDNAVAESFFASFKKEELYRKNYSSEKEFKQGVDSYIVFYNQQRPHRTLKNQTPEQVEVAFATQQTDM